MSHCSYLSIKEIPFEAIRSYFPVHSIGQACSSYSSGLWNRNPSMHKTSRLRNRNAPQASFELFHRPMQGIGAIIMASGEEAQLRQ